MSWVHLYIVSQDIQMKASADVHADLSNNAPAHIEWRLFTFNHPLEFLELNFLCHTL